MRRTLVILACCYAVAFLLGIVCILAAPVYIQKNLPAYAKKHASLDASVSDIRYTKRGIEIKGLRIKTADKDITVRQLLLAYPKSELRGIACTISREDGKKITVLTDADVVIQRDRSVQFSAPAMRVDVLGVAARIAAEGTLKNKVGEIECTLKDVTFDPLLKFLEKDDQLAWSGFFGGTASLAFDEKGFTTLDLKLDSQDFGTFAVKQEKALSFVKESYHMDETSYRALVDNMRNYRYNSSTVTMTKDGSVVMLVVDLSSQTYGTRHFEVALHDFL